MLLFGLGMGALLVLLGALVYVVAPRVGPNPIFGVRVGYSYASREVWDRTNRAGGGLMALVGAGIAALALFINWLNLAPGEARTTLTVVMIVALLAAVGWMFVYARRLAQGTAIAQELRPVKFRWAYLVPVLVTFGLLAVVAAYYYPLLPADRMATHFGFNDQPNGWMTRDAFMATYLGMALLFVALDGIAVLVATREPLIAFGRWGASWRLDPDRGLIYVGLALAVMNLILLTLLFDLVAFNTRGAHLFPLSNLLWVIAAVVVILIALFFLLGRRETGEPA